MAEQKWTSEASLAWILITSTHLLNASCSAQSINQYTYIYLYLCYVHGHRFIACRCISQHWHGVILKFQQCNRYFHKLFDVDVYLLIRVSIHYTFFSPLIVQYIIVFLYVYDTTQLLCFAITLTWPYLSLELSNSIKELTGGLQVVRYTWYYRLILFSYSIYCKRSFIDYYLLQYYINNYLISVCTNRA